MNNKFIEQILCKMLELRKGRELPVGTKRMWGGKPYIKTSQGWKPEKTTGDKKEEMPTTKPEIAPEIQQKRQEQLEGKKKAWSALGKKDSSINKLIKLHGEAKDRGDKVMTESFKAEIESHSNAQGYDKASIDRAMITADRQRKLDQWKKKWSNEG